MTQLELTASSTNMISLCAGSASHSPISEKRKSRNDSRHRRITRPSKKQETNCHLFMRSTVQTKSTCQVMNCYLTLIYALAQLLTMGSTSSEATSQIRSIWVSREDLQVPDKMGTNRSSFVGPIKSASMATRPAPAVPASARQQEERQQQQPIGEGRIDSGRTMGAVRLGASTANARAHYPDASANLHVSDSSLQPVAIEPEAFTQAGGQQVAQRRSLQPFADENTPRGPQFRATYLGNSSPSSNSSVELATSLDHQWSGTGNQSSQRPASMVASNAQVHFDEQHEEYQARARNHQPAEPKVKSRTHADTHDRRQDIFNTTEPTSNLAPMHEAHPQQFDEHTTLAMDKSNGPTTGTPRQPLSEKFSADPVAGAGGLGDNDNDNLSEPLDQSNRTAAKVVFARQNFSQLANREPQQTPAIYYLPDGDKWNHHHELVEDNLPTGTVGTGPEDQLRLVLASPNRIEGTLDQARKLQDGSSPAHQVNNLRWPVSSQQLIEHQARALSYGFVPSLTSVGPHTHGGQQGPVSNLAYSQQDHQATTPMPGYPVQFAQDLSAAMMDKFYLSQHVNPTPVAPLPTSQYQARREALPTMMPQTLHQIMSNSHLPAPPRRTQSLNNNAPQTSRVTQLGEAPHASQFLSSGSGTKSSFLRTYNPMQLLSASGGLGAAKTKKSLLSTLNDKFSTWTGSASDSDVSHLIESSFYEQSPNQQKGRPGAHRSVPRNRNQPQLAVGPMVAPPMLYWPAIRQPTVAPATSSLSNFYRVAPRPAQNPMAVHNHQQNIKSASGQHTQRQQQPGSQQQAANFIPVVAVQVTRTSPAPNALLDSTADSNKLDGDQYFTTRAQNQADSVSANEIDEYLASRTGHLSAASGNRIQSATSDLNERQKWDDSYGSAAAATTGHNQRHNSHPSGHSRTRRRHVASQPPVLLQPQHETTIKSAVFGYLPHQADAPLLQAMNLLQQLPAEKVQHHHHLQAAPGYSANRLPELGPYTLARGQAGSGQFAGSDGELYANQMDKSRHSVDAATHPLDYQSLAAVAAAAASAAASQQQHQRSPQYPFQVATNQAADEQPMSLALQLQANNYVQNDIAHPFGGHAAGSASFSQRASPGAKHAPLDVIYSSAHATDHLHYPAFQFMSPSQLGAYQDQLSQLAANPLLTSARAQRAEPASSPQAQHPFQGYTKQQGVPLDHLLATAPNDLNPLLMSPVFYQNPAGLAMADQFSSFYPVSDHKGPGGPSLGADSSASAGSEEFSHGDPSAGEQEPQSSTTTAATSGSSQQNQGLISKGKKRSGDFFASAGQLLLSALPLLLAPTLGLMFASSPANPAARLHGSPLGQANGAPGSLGIGQSQLSGGGGGNLPFDDGLVLNASPAPQLFTPTPPGSHTGASSYAADASLSSLLIDKLNESYGGGASQAAPVAPTTAAGTSTSAKPLQNQYYKSSNSLPALTGFRLDKPARGKPGTGNGHTNGSSSTSSTTTHRPFAIIMTTLGPSGSDANLSSLDLNSSASGGELDRNRTGPTLLVFESEPDQEQDNGERPGPSGQLNSTAGDLHAGQGFDSKKEVPQAHEQNVRRSSSVAPQLTVRTPSSTTKAPSSTIMYDIGYEGADFDAQFATLRKSDPHKLASLTTLAPSQPKPSGGNNYVKDRNHYQYDVLPPAASEHSADQPSHPDYGHAGDSPQTASVSKKLYPVSSWPPMRRKTVSLITSSGNKTLLDSSDRYANLMAATGAIEGSRDRGMHSSKRPDLGAVSEGLGGPSSGKSSSLAAPQPMPVVYDEQPFVLRKTSSQFEVGVHEGKGEQRLRPRLRTAGATRQQLNKKRLSTLDSFLVESPEVSSLPARFNHDRHQHKNQHQRKRRRKRDLNSGPLNEPVGANFVGSSEPLAQTRPRLSGVADEPAKASGQVVRLKVKKRKFTSRHKKRTKRVERRQDNLVESNGQPPPPQPPPLPSNDPHNDTRPVAWPIGNTNSSDPMARNDFRSLETVLRPYQHQPRANWTHEAGHELETLNRDSSKSKSAIVTAMITHVADGAADDDAHEDQAGGSGGPEDSSLSHEELREQLLAKKLLLDRLATRAGTSSSELHDLDERLPDEQPRTPEFNAGGRGRVRPTPVLDYIPYGVDQPMNPGTQQNFSATRFINNRASSQGARDRQRSRAAAMQVLNEDTKRALAKFGSLLLEDSLEMPAPARNETHSLHDNFGADNRKRSLTGAKNLSGVQQYSRATEFRPVQPPFGPNPASGYHAESATSYESGSATERYSTRATAAPQLSTGDAGWSRQFGASVDANQTREFDNRRELPHDYEPQNYIRPSTTTGNLNESSRSSAGDRMLTYQYPSTRHRHYSRGSGESSLSSARNLTMTDSDPRDDHFESARTSGMRQQSPAYNYNPGERPARRPSGQRHEVGVGDQAVAFETPVSIGKSESPINKYNNFLASHLSSNRTANNTREAQYHSSGDRPGDQLDAGYSSFSNYSTVAPAYSQHGNHTHRYDHLDPHHRDSHELHGYPLDDRATSSDGYHHNQTRNYNHPSRISSYPPPGSHYDHPYRHYPPQQAPASHPGGYLPQFHPRNPEHDHFVSGARWPSSHQPAYPHVPGDEVRSPPGLVSYQDSVGHLRYPTQSPQVGTHLHHSNQHSGPHEHHYHTLSSTTYAPASSHQTYGAQAPLHAPSLQQQHQYHQNYNHIHDTLTAASRPTESSKAVNDYLKRVQFSDSDRDKLMASYLTCDGLLNDHDHCLERLSCEFSDPQNIERANKLDRAVSSILLGHILINTYIPNAFKMRLKSASLLGYTQTGTCSKFACSKLTSKREQHANQSDPGITSGEETKSINQKFASNP